jgi:SNF2 family DNA or RNA helicase
MIVLHAGVEDGQLVLWGEAPAEALPSRRRGRKARAGTGPVAHPSPFDPGADRLVAALNEAVPTFSATPKEVGGAVAWLPSAGGRPLASSPLIADPPEPGVQAELAPWTVAALLLSPERTVDLLCACVGRDTLAAGVVVGKPLAFWAGALRFAGALVARQQFLPGEEARGKSGRARWEPVLAGADAGRLAALARAMPSACRALGRGSDTPPQVGAAAVLSDFLAEVLDHLVRSALGPPAPVAVPGRRQRKQTAAAFDSVHDQWLHALRAPAGLMQGDGAELTRLAEQVREWRRPIAAATAAPFRLCFRLEEPPAQPNGDLAIGDALVKSKLPWHVRYLLQAVDDPSLLVPVADAWEPRGRQAAVLQRGGFKPREYLLSALGQAAGISPRIEDSLKTAAPDGYELDATGAHEFLTEKALLLEQADFGVLLPAWWTRKGTKLRLSLRADVKSPALQASSGLTLAALFEFDWRVALGEHTLSLKELETLARLKEPLVQVRGQWVQLNAEEIQAALDFWKNREGGRATLRDVVQMALGVAKVPGGLDFGGVTATGWINDFLAQLEGRSSFEELPAPQGFQGTLRPYQVRGYSWLGFLRRWGLGACLADDMGLGKTVQTLALIQRDWREHHRPVLLICPMSVVGNWQKEAARFTPELSVLVHHGLKRVKGDAFQKQADRHALVLSSYALLHRDFELLRGVNWAGLILDEAQNIKNPDTKQARAARSLRADYRAALTGTPVENHVGDLWSLMEFLNPGFLGNQAEFRRNFFVPIQAQHDPEATGRLKKLTGPFVLRRLKTDKAIIADLPDKLEMKVFCNLTREQASLYAAVVRDAGKELDETTGIQRKGVVLATLSKLKQVCNHPAHFLGDNSAIPGRSGKLARLTEMLEEALEAGDRALVFTQFAEMGAIIRKHLQETFGREVLFLHGGVAKKQRDLMVSRFQEANGGGDSPDGPCVFVLSLKAGGTGLNLTAANHVFHFDRWWNPAVENQATDRAFRIGQRRNVQVHKFLCAGTLEEKIDEMIEDKQEVAGRIVGSGEGWLTELSTADLKELFALRADAVGE